MCYAYRVQKYENKLKHLKINIKSLNIALLPPVCHPSAGRLGLLAGFIVLQ
jgi:hypothetical protein